MSSARILRRRRRRARATASAALLRRRRRRTTGVAKSSAQRPRRRSKLIEREMGDAKGSTVPRRAKRERFQRRAVVAVAPLAGGSRQGEQIRFNVLRSRTSRRGRLVKRSRTSEVSHRSFARARRRTSRAPLYFSNRYRYSASSRQFYSKISYSGNSANANPSTHTVPHATFRTTVSYLTLLPERFTSAISISTSSSTRIGCRNFNS